MILLPLKMWDSVELVIVLPSDWVLEDFFFFSENSLGFPLTGI